MRVNTLIKEIMWEYDLSKKKSKALVNRYRKQGAYESLCDIVKYKRQSPKF